MPWLAPLCLSPCCYGTHDWYEWLIRTEVESYDLSFYHDRTLVIVVMMNRMFFILTFKYGPVKNIIKSFNKMSFVEDLIYFTHDEAKRSQSLPQTLKPSVCNRSNSLCCLV